MMLDRLRIIGVLLLVSSLFVAPHDGVLQEAHAQTVSVVYVDPVSTRDVAIGSKITVDIRMNLVAGERINGFDVRLNYTNWGRAPTGVLDALSLEFSANIFAGGSAVVSAKCVDGVALDSDGFCPADDSPSGGQVHLAQTLVGTPISGPLSSQLLFSIGFSVNGTGPSLFVLDRANILNPGPDQFPAPHFLQVVTRAGVFGNGGLVAFFDFEPPVPPAILPGQNVIFDASASFKAGVSSIQNPSYSWDFGDGTPLEVTGPSVGHSFGLPGRYRVRLSLTDSGNESGQVERTVVVVPALGGLQVTVRDQKGSPFRLNVRVLLFNSTVLTAPALNKTIDGSGVVVFDGLLPGPYLLRFSGPTLEGEESMQMQVIAGWTSLETVYLTAKTFSPPGGGYGDIVFFGGILAGLGVAGTAIFLQRRSQKKARTGKTGSGRSVGGKPRRPGRR